MTLFLAENKSKSAWSLPTETNHHSPWHLHTQSQGQSTGYCSLGFLSYLVTEVMTHDRDKGSEPPVYSLSQCRQPKWQEHALKLGLLQRPTAPGTIHSAEKHRVVQRHIHLNASIRKAMLLFPWHCTAPGQVIPTPVKGKAGPKCNTLTFARAGEYKGF